jgi:MFS superfamily sulfate permease-like transporter
MQDLPPEKYTSERVIPNPPALAGEANDTYRSQLLEQHKHFVEMTMRYWNHIETANHFFLSLHTLILSGFTYLFTSAARLPTPVLAMLVVISCAMALQWLMVLRSLQRLNQVRHEIIQEWEAGLAARPYQVEYYKLYNIKGARGARYFRIQRLYMLIPLLVFMAYLVFGVLITLDIKIRQ